MSVNNQTIQSNFQPDLTPTSFLEKSTQGETTTKKTEEFSKGAYIEISSENRKKLKSLPKEIIRKFNKIKGFRTHAWTLINENKSIFIYDAAIINKIAGEIIFDLKLENVEKNANRFTGGASSDDLQSIISNAEQMAKKEVQDLQDHLDSKKSTKRPRKNVTESSEPKSKKQRLTDTAPQHVVQPIAIPVMCAPSSQTSIPSYAANNSNSEEPLSQQFVSSSNSSSEVVPNVKTENRII